MSKKESTHTRLVVKNDGTVSSYVVSRKLKEAPVLLFNKIDKYKKERNPLFSSVRELAVYKRKGVPLSKDKIACRGKHFQIDGKLVIALLDLKKTSKKTTVALKKNLRERWISQRLGFGFELKDKEKMKESLKNGLLSEEAYRNVAENLEQEISDLKWRLSGNSIPRTPYNPPIVKPVLKAEPKSTEREVLVIDLNKRTGKLSLKIKSDSTDGIVFN